MSLERVERLPLPKFVRIICRVRASIAHCCAIEDGTVSSLLYSILSTLLIPLTQKIVSSPLPLYVSYNSQIFSPPSLSAGQLRPYSLLHSLLCLLRFAARFICYLPYHNTRATRYFHFSSAFLSSLFVPFIPFFSFSSLHCAYVLAI